MSQGALGVHPRIVAKTLFGAKTEDPAYVRQTRSFSIASD
jgi:hypothetical protein